METKEKKVYLSNLKQIGQTTGLKGRIYADKTSEHWQTDEKGRKYLPFSIWQNREPDQYGNTHAMILDTWKPNQSIFEKMAETNEKIFKDKKASDLPF